VVTGSGDFVKRSIPTEAFGFEGDGVQEVNVGMAELTYATP
jgi:hypothetical protein